MKLKYFLLIFTIIFFLNSCGSNSSSGISQEFSLLEKEFVHNLFLTEYLWYDEVIDKSEIDYSQFTQPQEMINRLKITPPDSWSFTITQQQYEDFVNQKTVGFGFGYRDNFKIFIVRIDSPAYTKLQRGDQIVEINGEVVSNALISAASKNINEDTRFTVLRNGINTEITLRAREYSFKVSLGKIITQGSKKVGYLRYDSFTESSVAEFETIFTKFHNEQIDELVIDLRYNGGGSLSTTSALLDNITNAYPGHRQMYLDWNDKKQNKNSNYTFEDSDFQDGNELTMQRVIFLVTKHSASASEALINALKPYLGYSNVITIGEETQGKPVGMAGRSYGNNYYFLINFFVKNNTNDTTSFNGIPATCSAEDDINHILGDSDEKMLSIALYYIENNICP